MVDVESSVVKIIYNIKMSFENHLRILFSPYPIHSVLGATLPLFVLTVLLIAGKFYPRFTGLVSTFSLLVSSAVCNF